MLEIVQGTNFAGGVPCKAVHGIGSVHAETVIVHLEQLDATALNHHLDAARRCLQGILHEHFDQQNKAGWRQVTVWASPWLWRRPLRPRALPLWVCGGWRFTPGVGGRRGRARRWGLAWRLRVTPRAFLGKETLI